MKATELMIGDWVKLKTDDGTFIKVHISALSFEYIWGIIDDDEANDAIGYDYLEPIPLTAEILEKNKFSIFGESYYVLFNKDMTIRFSLYFPSKDNYWLIIGHRNYSIRSVHELQHALRLCGIEKEIEL